MFVVVDMSIPNANVFYDSRQIKGWALATAEPGNSIVGLENPRLVRG